jgi:hypothetical protein
MLRSMLLVLALAMGSGAKAQAWAPPPNPDPGQILKEARADARAGRLDEAANKHRWYHANAVTIDRAQSGVRLSFALGDWAALAERHAPARKDMEAARERAAIQLKNAADAASAGHAFHELLSFDRQVQRWASIRDSYAALSQRHPEAATRALHLALPALAQMGEHELAARHLLLEPLLQELSQLHADLWDSKRFPAEQQAAMRAFQARHTDHEWARVVWVLVKSGRQDEAERSAAQGRKLMGQNAGSPRIDAALRGEAPPAQINTTQAWWISLWGRLANWLG